MFSPFLTSALTTSKMLTPRHQCENHFTLRATNDAHAPHDNRDVSIQHVRTHPVPFHVRCHTLNLNTCSSKPQWMLLRVARTESYCQNTFWSDHFPVKYPMKKAHLANWFRTRSVKWHRRVPAGCIETSLIARVWAGGRLERNRLGSHRFPLQETQRPFTCTTCSPPRDTMFL